MKGPRDFGLDSFSPRECADAPLGLKACQSDDIADLKGPGNRLLRIGAKAAMGFVYDGSRIRPKSKVSITISFGTETDGGIGIGGSTTIEKEIGPRLSPAR